MYNIPSCKQSQLCILFDFFDIFYVYAQAVRRRDLAVSLPGYLYALLVDTDWLASFN